MAICLNDQLVATLRNANLTPAISEPFVVLAHYVILTAKHMPKGPKGQKRPADVISNAVTVMKIATGEIEESLTEDGKSRAAGELGRKGGLARAKKVSKARRLEIARSAAQKRWDSR